MGITIDSAVARITLKNALDIARSEDPVPADWVEFTRYAFTMSSKTNVPALGTALLAKATDPDIDPLALKVTYSDRAYPFRTLGHEVLVPGAHKYGFSIRTTSREPLNNQPFFRYDHLDKVDRVRNQEQFGRLKAQLRILEGLSKDEALRAFAAFLRVADEEARLVKTITLGDGEISPADLLDAVAAFLAVGVSERPKRLQAIAAAAIGLCHVDVRSRKINDPSKDYPGDVQAYANDLPFLSVEVRGKSVPFSELEAFSTSCARAGIGKVMLAVDHPTHRPIDGARLDIPEQRAGVVSVSIYESMRALVSDAIDWCDVPLLEATRRFADEALERLREIEASPAVLAEWANLAGRTA